MSLRVFLPRLRKPGEEEEEEKDTIITTTRTNLWTCSKK
jgi:hypothetical protein